MTAPASSTSTTRTFAPERRAAPGRHAGGARASRVYLLPPEQKTKVPTKRLMDVEALLTWAFREELPKRRDDEDGRPREYKSISPMFAMAALGGRVENFSREPGFPLAMGDPHPDAVLVEEAVLGLARFADHRFDGPLGLITDLPRGLDEHAAMAGAMSQIVELVRIKARLGGRPSFAASPVPAAIVDNRGRPQVMIMRGTKEEPCSAEGKDRYPRGAYCPLHWDNPTSILIERAQYAAWWAGIDVIAHELAGKLATIGVLPPSAAQRPWTGEVDAVLPKRVLDNPESRRRLREMREDRCVDYLLRHRRRSTRRKASARPTQAGPAAVGQTGA